MALRPAPLDMEALQSGTIFEVETNDVWGDPEWCLSDEDSSGSESVDLEEILEKTTLKGKVIDEDTYEEGTFDEVAEKMTDLTYDGKIKKRVLREGYGIKVRDFASVKIHYNAYTSHQAKPFDSTYERCKPLRFTLNEGKVIAGLEFGVKSMKVNEHAQFLIVPEYAYRNSLVGRVPPNATVLFEVELLECVDSGAAVTFDNLAEEHKRDYHEVYKYALALTEKGKQSFINRDMKHAIKSYIMAVTKLENVLLNGREEVAQHHELILRLYTNLMVCYGKTGEGLKGCKVMKKINELTDDGESMDIPAKAHFNHGKCLRTMGQYDKSSVALHQALAIEPKNPDVAKELLNLEKDKNEAKDVRTVFAKALVGDAPK